MPRRTLQLLSLSLLFMLGYALGARETDAQLEGPLHWASVGFYGDVLVVSGRTLYFGGPPGLSVHPFPIPGSAEVVGGGPRGSGAIGGVRVVLSNGDTYESQDFGPGGGGFQPWVFSGNLLGVATSSERTSWGSVKVRYR